MALLYLGNACKSWLPLTPFSWNKYLMYSEVFTGTGFLDFTMARFAQVDIAKQGNASCATIILALIEASIFNPRNLILKNTNQLR